MRSHWTNRTVVNCTTTLLVAAGLLVACDRENEPMAPTASSRPEVQFDAATDVDRSDPGPLADVLPTPVALDVDVTQLVPATVELAAPMVCGDFTVYDQDDVAILCSPVALAATPIVSPTCPQTVSGSVRLEVDLHCFDTPGLIVGADNTVIDLNGHKIFCTGAGYFGSCQGPVIADGDIGINTNNHSNVHIFSHVPGGTVEGFDTGILVQSNSNDIKVKQLLVTGPAGATGARRPSFVVGIQINGTDCGGGNIRIGGGTRTGNEISHHLRGIQTAFSSCLEIGHNYVHDNRKNVLVPIGGSFSHAIAMFDSPNNHIHSNVVPNNGDGFFIEGGPALINPGSMGNLVNGNVADRNLGNGIETVQGASDNYIVNNQMLQNTDRDAFSDQSGPNRWNENNRCVTQTTPQPPPGVCGPDEA